jgi:acyl-CoA hydrolase
MTSRAFLTFASIDRDGNHLPVRPLLIETEQDMRRCEEAQRRRAERLRRRASRTTLGTSYTP